MATFYLKYRDTRPALQVVLLNPDKSVYDLTGATSPKLHIWLSDGTKISRDMTIEGAPTAGTLQYIWLVTDWDPGGLAISPADPISRGSVDHRIEYELIDVTGGRVTFPNAGYDTLHITADIGQG